MPRILKTVVTTKNKFDNTPEYQSQDTNAYIPVTDILVAGDGITINTDSQGRLVFNSSGASDYSDLENIPIVNADLDADGFTPIEGTYYRHTGTGGGAAPFVVGQTYDKVYFDTSKTVEEMLEIITTEFDWDDAEETAGLKYFKLVGKANADFFSTHNTIILAYFQDYNVYLLSSNINDNLIWASTDFGYFSQGWSSDNAEFDEPIEIEVADNKPFISATPFSASSYQTGTIYKYEYGEYKPIPEDINWGKVKGTITDQQDLVQYIATQINNAVGNIATALQTIRGTVQ